MNDLMKSDLKEIQAVTHSKEPQTVEEIPEKYRVYDMYLFDGDVIQITAEQKKKIQASGAQWIVLPNNEEINKAHVKKFYVNKPKTKENYLKQHPVPSETPEELPEPNKEGVRSIR
jgi:hypothetical protein